MKVVCPAAEGILDDLYKNFEEESDRLRNFLCLCESPAEQILVAAVYSKFGMKINTHYQRMQAEFSGYPAYDGIFTLNVELQKPITTAVFQGRYRADLFFYLTRFWMNGEQPTWGKMVVEVDGHDFHDRTKEQASRDRQRDRDLLLDGYKVIRFTGSDVYQEPYRCAEEIEFLIGNEANDVLLSYWGRGLLAELLLGPRREN